MLREDGGECDGERECERTDVMMIGGLGVVGAGGTGEVKPFLKSAERLRLRVVGASRMDCVKEAGIARSFLSLGAGRAVAYGF